MTTSTTKTNPSKASPAKVEPTQDNTPEVVVEEKEVSRIPEALIANPILAEFCGRYLASFDEITEYNKQVLADRDSEWNSTKVLEKARELGRPTDKDAKPNEDISKALKVWEDSVNAMNLARKSVLDKTSKVLNITLSATEVRSPELEAPLKEKRKIAIEIGTNLNMLAKMTNDETASSAVLEFLAKNPLPAIGREQTRSFGSEGVSTPKYRVHVQITKDGETLLDEDGFTKTALALTKPTFGYERGKAPKSDTLRTVWEKVGNTPEKTVKTPVEFDDNGLHFVISKKG